MNPFANQYQECVGDLGESKVIESIRQWLGDASAESPYGIGDDCALIEIPAAMRQLATVDPVIYGKHFDDTVSPANAASKLLKRNASDIAAMGGTPAFALINLCLAQNTLLEWLEEFYKSLAREALNFGIQIAGGDLSQNATKHVSASMTLMGWIPNNIAPLLRKKASDEDIVFVTGALGGSILENHYSFTPRLEEGRFLAENNWASACLDLSDGLGKDALQLAAPSNVALLDCSKIPISDDAWKLARETGKPALHHAINDGEDYELLFTVKKANKDEFLKYWEKNLDTPINEIGRIKTAQSENEAKLQLINNKFNVELLGYEHLR